MSTLVKRTNVWLYGLVAVLALLFSPSWASATSVLYHQSTENFYNTGGTLVTGCLGNGCPPGTPPTNFSQGDTTGSITWQVQEKAFFNDMTGTVMISYTVFNDTLDDNITSFHVSLGSPPDSVSSGPTGWTSMVLGNEVWWQTNNISDGIPGGESKDTMMVSYTGQTKPIGIVFRPVARDFIDGEGVRQTVTSPDWIASSTIPEPGSVLLLGSGLIGFGFLARRRNRSGRGSRIR